MSHQVPQEAREAATQARAALRRGNKSQARSLARLAAALAPRWEDPWLLLATVATPRASLEYLRRALLLNPDSDRARRGMRWALKRAGQYGLTVPADPSRYPPLRATAARWGISAGAVLTTLGFGFCLILGWSLLPARSVQASHANAQVASISALKMTNTPLPTPTPISTATPTRTAHPTLPATWSPTVTLAPSMVPTAARIVPPVPVGKKEPWIDIDLTTQILYAYRGNELERHYVVSTGTWITPTKPGQFQIYAKYESAPMWGVDYYLPGVPYVMYYDGDYGIHGAYWHDNFGTPMSHGCINMGLREAEWLFNFAQVGTWVHIHD